MDESISNDELATMIEIYVNEMAKRDYRRARLLLTRLAVELIDQIVAEK